jgi:KUP system potassium uptake protein
MPLAGATGFERSRALVGMGLFGAALIYSDGIITPAISVLSALEGVNVATKVFEPYLMPMAVGVLLCLFAVQGRGTARIGKIFGPLRWRPSSPARQSVRRDSTRQPLKSPRSRPGL